MYLIYLVHPVYTICLLVGTSSRTIDQNAFETGGYFRFYCIQIKTHSYFFELIVNRTFYRRLERILLRLLLHYT